jgi:hypothetical protein
MEHYHILSFLFALSLTNKFLVGGLGVEYLPNDPSHGPILLHLVLGQIERLPIKTNNT